MAQKRTGNAKDQNFVNAFVTASLTVCIGAMAVIGSIILVMSASMGKGCAFSAVPVLLLQGGMTLLARVLQPFMTDAAMASLSCVGSVLIFCVGVNLLLGKRIRVANLLPALLVAVAFAVLPV